MDLLAVSVLLEIALYSLSPLWRFRRSIAIAISVLVLFPAIITWVFDPINVIYLTISLLRAINLARIITGRLNEQYLRRSAARTGLIFIGCQVVTVWLIVNDFQFISSHLLLITALQLLLALIVWGVTVRNLHRTAYHSTLQYVSDKDLPTVTVALPARNETADLSSCLQTIIASDYPKLEILVLDDCSQDRTAEIIKGFAQDGVRFIKGEPPRPGWLSKNQAYEALAHQANGEVILFCGVDVRFGPEAIRSIITNMIHKKRSMISLMPFRIGGGVRTAFIQPLRYWWEIALPRRLFNRPPVLSTCWVIKRKTLKRLGGFSAVANSIIPEGYFARELVKSDQYTFARANELLDLRTVKSVEEQLKTALRMRYPQLSRRPENVLLLSLAETVFLLFPFGFALSGLWLGFGAVQWLGLLTSLLLIITHYMIMAASNPANSAIALFNLPLVILTEIALLYVSMYKYEFSALEWRGRNICVPVMRAIPHLPKL